MEAERWKNDHGDVTLKVTYPLDIDSVVFDVGGYHGDWTHEINKRHHCLIHLFEPVAEFYEVCRKRFNSTQNIICHNMGLWSRDLSVPFRANGDSSSVYANDPDCIISLCDIVGFMAMHQITHVDLMSLNCEGGEYHILDRLLETHQIECFEHIQIQFHMLFTDAAGTRDNLRHRLRRTHREVWCYPFVWESWQRLSDVPTQ
jgi:FkbM family methyltransferase